MENSTANVIPLEFSKGTFLQLNCIYVAQMRGKFCNYLVCLISSDSQTGLLIFV